MMKLKKNRVELAAVIVCALAMLFFELAKISFSDDETISGIINMVITRALGSAMFAILVFRLGYRVTNPLRAPLGRSLLFILPCLVVVVNLPIIALVRECLPGLTPGGSRAFALECLCRHVYELAFRGASF